MTQFAVIKNLKGHEKAEVEVLRGTACGDMCQSCGVCKYASKIRVSVKNAIGAGVGDTVEIEAQTSRILSMAALVYVMPLVLLFAGYFVGAAFSLSEGMCVLMGFGFFALGLVFAVVIGRMKSKMPINYNITRIVESGELV